jgi:hypothetical protein
MSQDIPDARTFTWGSGVGTDSSRRSCEGRPVGDVGFRRVEEGGGGAAGPTCEAHGHRHRNPVPASAEGAEVLDPQRELVVGVLPGELAAGAFGVDGLVEARDAPALCLSRPVGESELGTVDAAGSEARASAMGP